MINNSSIGNDSINQNNGTNDSTELNQIYTKSKDILNTISNSDDILIEYEKLVSLSQNDNNIKNESAYFLINREWMKKFKKFCEAKEYFSDFIMQPKIDNSNLIIEDDSVLKLKNEQLYFFDKNHNAFDNCIFIKKEIWEQLFEMFGGGPTYKIISNNDHYTNLIKDGGHVNLLFIPNKKYISQNYNHFITKKYIFFDLNKKVIDLKQYVNKILNIYKKDFGIKNKENLKENKHYRLWLYTSFVGSLDDLLRYLEKQISKSIEEKIINWKNFDEKDYQMNLLSNFDDNEIKDIFPNDYTDFFDSKQYANIKRKQASKNLPEFTIIIEQMPEIFLVDNGFYKIGKCSICENKEIIYCDCPCQNFYVCYSCGNHKSRGAYSHHSKCRAYLMDEFTRENEEFSKNKNLVYPLIGLLNLGNTCYMNSALQCMRSIKELTTYLIYSFDESQINEKNIIGTGGFLTKAYINLIYNLNRSKKDYYNPEFFKNTIGLIDDRFSGNDQQDTHEFMTFLIDSIHEDLNKVINKPKINRKESEYTVYYSSGLNDKQSTIEWNNFLKRNQSVMVDLFYGQYKATISCTYCNHKSVNFSTYLSLQLPIPKTKEFILVKIIFLGDWLYKCPYIKMSIIMNKLYKKISVAKEIIGEILDIDTDELQIIQMKDQEIIKIYDDEEEIDEKVPFYVVAKTNKKTVDNNLISPKVIDYSNLKQNINDKKEELIKIFENNSIDDSYDIDIDIDIGPSITNKNDDNYLDKIIIKHFYLKDNEISNKIIFKDNLFYFHINKSCYDIYYKIFEIYYELFTKNDSNQINDDKPKKILFQKYFDNFIDKDNEFTNDIFEKYESLPFVLKYGEELNKENIFIPPLKKYIFKNFINHKDINNLNKNKCGDNNHNNNIFKQSEQQENHDQFNNLENHNNLNIKEDENDEKIDGDLEMNNLQYNTSQNNINNNSRKDYDPLKDYQNISNHKKTNNTNTKNVNNLYINIRRDDDKIEEPKKTKILIIIWNPKYLKRDETKNNYYLFKKTLEEIDLLSFFKNIYENIFQKVSINRCFEEFSKEETFDKDNLWKCSKCHKNIAAHNKIEIYQTPKILIIQLKRFENNQKIGTFIDFPLKDLDISQFVFPDSKINNDIPKKYDLFAVANHYGRLEYGHYDAFCLNYIDNNWYNFNDRFVEKIKKEDENNQIVTKNAYVLFYRQQKNDLIEWESIYNKKFYDINDNNMKKYGEDFIYQNTNNKKSVKNMEKESNEEIFDFDELSLGSYVYNPFKENYLKLKRKLDKDEIKNK